MPGFENYGVEQGYLVDPNYIPHFLEISAAFPDNLIPLLDQHSVSLIGITPDQQHWRDHGYVIKQNFIDNVLIDEYLDIRRKLNLGSGEFPNVIPFMNHSVIRDMCCSKRLHYLLVDLLGEELGLHFLLTSFKSTERGWHQDDYLNPADTMARYAAVWIALDDIDPDCGPFEFVPGSHKWPCLRREKVKALVKPELRETGDHHWALIAEHFVNKSADAYIEERKAEVARFAARKGDILIWHGRLLHRGSIPNNPNLLRPALIAHYSNVRSRRDLPTHIARHDEGGYFWNFSSNGRPLTQDEFPRIKADPQSEMQQTAATLALEQKTHAETREALAEARTEVELLTTSLAAVQTSTSWRVTKPLRSAKNLARLVMRGDRSKAGALEQKPRKLTARPRQIGSTGPSGGADPLIKTNVPMIDANGARIPRIGLGTLFLRGAECVRATETALSLGYRHIDTAVMYGNETEVGNAIWSSGLPRNELFITTKILPKDIGEGDLQRSAAASLQRLGLDYVDLLLLHWPNPAIPLPISIKALCDAKKRSFTRHIGVSNFTTELFKAAVALAADHGERLVANQCEYHPQVNQSALLGACRANGAAFVSHTPLGHGRLLDDPMLLMVAQRVGKTPAQVLLRWNIQQPGTVAIPKSAQPARLAENLQVFDFELSDRDMHDLFGIPASDGGMERALPANG